MEKMTTGRRNSPDTPAMLSKCRNYLRPSTLSYRKPVFAGGVGGGDEGAFAAGTASLPFSRGVSALSRLLSDGRSIPLPDTSCAASTV